MSEQTSGLIGQCSDTVHFRLNGALTCVCGAQAGTGGTTATHHQPPQPSLTPADLIALRGIESAVRAAASDDKVIDLDYADELDALITRLSAPVCETCGGPCVYQGSHP